MLYIHSMYVRPVRYLASHGAWGDTPQSLLADLPTSQSFPADQVTWLYTLDHTPPQRYSFQDILSQA
jgi:hypothetical protein